MKFVSCDCRIRFGALFLFLLLTCGCSKPRAAAYDKAIESGKTSIPFITEMCRFYPSTRNSISYYTGEHATPTWTSKVGLHGRYVLVVQMEFKMDGSRQKVISWSDPTFYLYEVDRIVKDSNSLVPGNLSLKFGLKEWNRVANNNGDLGSLGVTLKKDRPVTGFEGYWPGS